MNVPFNAVPVEVETRTPADFVASLPGKQITRELMDAIGHEIQCIERERIIRSDLSFCRAELDMLKAYEEQCQRVCEHGRDKAAFERTHPAIPYPWSMPT